VTDERLNHYRWLVRHAFRGKLPFDDCDEEERERVRVVLRQVVAEQRELDAKKCEQVRDLWMAVGKGAICADYIADATEECAAAIRGSK